MDNRSSLGFLPGQYVNVQVPGHRPGPVVLVQLRAGRATRSRSSIRNTTYGVLTTYLRDRAKTGDKISFNGPLGSFYLRKIERPVLFLAGGTGLAPFLSMLHKIEQDGGSEHPIHLIFGVTNDPDLVEVDEAGGLRRAHAELHLHLRGGGGGEQLPEQGLRHPPHEARAPQRRRSSTSTSAVRRRWSTRSASTWPTRASSRRASTTRSSRAPAWSARSASRTSRPSTPTRRSTRGWRWSWGPPSSVLGKLSAEQLAEYRRLAEATGTAHQGRPLHRPGGLPGGQLGLPPVPDRGHRERGPARGLPQAAGAGVHGPGADARRSTWSATSPRTTSRSSTRSSSGDFEALRRDHRRTHRPREGDDAGRHREAGDGLR